MIRRPPRSTLDRSSAASDVYKRQRSVMKLSWTKFDAGDEGRSYTQRIFLEHISKISSLMSELEGGLGSFEDAQRQGRYDEFGDFLFGWSQTWNLDVDWVRKWAVGILMSRPKKDLIY